jgi:dipeptidyl aminopeptidase/acylaminoacyl peptidase
MTSLPKTGRCFYLLILLFFASYEIKSQDGRIITRDLLILHDSVYKQLDSMDHSLKNELQKVNLYRITYLSDGHKVIGYLAEPKQKGKYPCILANRGGRWNFSLWNPLWAAYQLGRMASWGYVVVASQYRGSADGGEGREEYGGKDVNDVLNLLPLLSEIPNADTSRIGMYGESRGGMMTYLTLKRSCAFKGAAIVAGLADCFDMINRRPELEQRTFRDLIPDYDRTKDSALRARSAIYWPDAMCKRTPLLIMHGSGDARADASQSIRLVEQLHKFRHPVRFILFEGADHAITQFEKEMYLQCRRHFDDYVRDGKPLPNLQLNGR